MSAAQSSLRERLEVRAKRGYVIHGVVYVLVNSGLATLNLIRNPQKLWFLWVVGGWGAGMLLHTFLVFCPPVFNRILDRRVKRLQDRS